MLNLFWDLAGRSVGDMFNWRYFLKGGIVHVSSELCIHGQAVPVTSKGHSGGWLITLAPPDWRTEQGNSRHLLTCQLFSLKMYTWWQNQTIKKRIGLSENSDRGMACCILHVYSFHIWSVQSLFFFFKKKAISMKKYTCKDRENESKWPFSTVNQWQWWIRLETTWFLGLP